ncbi:MAG: hypothetical protein JOZ45_03460 [Acidobacteriaceae bacterium]|nr:hypothetical protein [Acidobacteriaceae bacterium]MBV9940308.1 hypothetical protein [Acidobacteriaceae bacterium]
MTSATSTVSLVLFLLSLFCLGSWITTFKLAGKGWRFELFAVDFALGTVVFSSLAAFALGNSLSDLPFSDRILLSSKTAQVLVLLAGLVFGLANFLLLGAVSLLGIAGSFPLCIGLGLIVNALLNFRFYHPGALFAGLALLVFSVILDGRACRSRDLAMPVTKKATNQPPKAKGVRSFRGLTVAVIGGILLGTVYPLAEGGLYGDLGLGPYAGLLFFCVGVLISTLLFSVVFFNIALEGPRLNVHSYFAAQPRRHLFGLAGGAFWAVGVLSALLAKPAVAGVPSQQPLTGFLPLGSALLAMLWGALIWREFAAAPPKARLSLAGTAVLLVVGSLLIGSAYIR